MRWTPGVGDTRIVVSGGTAINAGTNNNMTIRGLPTNTTQTVTAINDYGMSQTITAVVVPPTPTIKLGIPYQIYPVTWECIPGKTNTLWRISDLQRGVWTPIVSFVGTNGSCSILQTNIGAQGFWRVSVE